MQARFNGFPAVNINGSPAPGKSSGEAMEEMERIAREDLPPGFGYDWGGQSFQERLSGGEAPLLFGLSSWSCSCALPRCTRAGPRPSRCCSSSPSASSARSSRRWLAGLPNDVFFKVGLITIIGLAAKNAILIVEFAIEEQKRGKALYDSVIEAARLRSARS